MTLVASRLGNQAIEIMNNRERIHGLPEIEPGLAIHFIGIGGIGMSGLARICMEKGCQVSGTDRSENEQTRELVKRGARIGPSEDPEAVIDCGLVVYSSAVSPNHSERRTAENAGIPTIRRGTLLAHLTRGQKLLAVGGTHGKTTTSSMLALAARSAGLDPTIVIGGQVPQLGSNAQLGTDDFTVVESDESDGSFLELDPYLAIVTNVEDDHLDHYGALPTLRNAFAEFLTSVPERDNRIVCGDCPSLYNLARRELGDEGFKSYGFSEWCRVRGEDLRLDRDGSSCRVLRDDEPVGSLRIRVPGRHMLSNALGVYAAGLSLGWDKEKVAFGLSEFTGTRRRFEVLGTWRGATFIDDYAHHPTEIRATLQALEQYTEGRCVAVFQPHRYSRTDQLFDEFAETFSGVDLLILTEIYAAGEEPRPGVTSKHLLSRIQGVGECVYAPELAEVEAALKEHLKEGDAVLFLGAGNVNSIAYRLLEEGK